MFSMWISTNIYPDKWGCILPEHETHLDMQEQWRWALVQLKQEESQIYCICKQRDNILNVDIFVTILLRFAYNL